MTAILMSNNCFCKVLSAIFKISNLILAIVVTADHLLAVAKATTSLINLGGDRLIKVLLSPNNCRVNKLKGKFI